MANRTDAQIFKLMVDDFYYRKGGFMCWALDDARTRGDITAKECNSAHHAIHAITNSSKTMRDYISEKVFGNPGRSDEVAQVALEVYEDWDNRDQTIRIAVEIFAH